MFVFILCELIIQTNTVWIGEWMLLQGSGWGSVSLNRIEHRSFKCLYLVLIRLWISCVVTMCGHCILFKFLMASFALTVGILTSYWTSKRTGPGLVHQFIDFTSNLLIRGNYFAWFCSARHKCWCQLSDNKKSSFLKNPAIWFLDKSRNSICWFWA